MSEQESQAEETSEDTDEDRRTEALNEAWQAAMKALWALIIVLMTLLLRALQALFTLARPAALVGCVVALGYGAATLYPTLFRVYGGDIPAALVAALAVIVVPAALMILADRYDVFVVALASGALMIGAREVANRSPPVVLSMAIPVSIGAVFFYFTRKETKDNEQENGAG